MGVARSPNFVGVTGWREELQQALGGPDEATGVVAQIENYARSGKPAEQRIAASMKASSSSTSKLQTRR